MEIPLSEGQSVIFTSVRNDWQNNHSTPSNIYLATASLPTSPASLNEYYKSSLWQKVRLRFTNDEVDSSNWKRMHSLQLEIGCIQSTDRDISKGYIKIHDSAASGILETLSKDSKLPIKLNGNLTFTGASTEPTNRWGYRSLSKSEMTKPLSFQFGVPDITHKPSLGVYGCQITDENFPLEFANFWLNSGLSLTGTINITAIIPVNVVSTVDSSTFDNLRINKKILHEEIGCDVTIMPKNGASIKCHRSFLSAHSAVFHTMFQTSMKESDTNDVEIPDMTEESVRALLAYMYYWDVEEARKNSLVCFELLHAGHKYDINNLDETMNNILLSEGNEWFDVDVAMRMFVFARFLPDRELLKMKAIQVLKLKFDVLETSECYQELFKKDPKAAMELCKYAFSV